MTYRVSRRTNGLWDVDWRDPINTSHSLNRGRLAWWLTASPRYFGGLQWYDLVSGVPGVLSGFTSGYGWNPASYPSGKGSIVFPGGATGTSAGIPVTLKSSLSSPDIQCGIWFNTTDSTSFRVLVWGRNTGNGSLFVIDTQSGSVRFSIGRAGSGGSFQASCTSSSTYNDGKWHRAVANINSSGNMFLFVDGVLAATNLTGSATNIQINACYIGWDGNPNRSNTNGVFNGYLNDIFWSSPWSAPLITLDYTLGQQGYPGVLWRLRRTAWFLKPPPSPPPSTSKPIAAYTRRGVVIGTGIF